MRNMLAHINDADPTFPMLVSGTVTTAIGVLASGTIAAQQFDERIKTTFGQGGSWKWITALFGESLLAMFFLLIGSWMLIALWFWTDIQNKEERGETPRHDIAAFRFNRFVWGAGAMLWFGAGASAIQSNPTGSATIWFAIGGIMQMAWLQVRVGRHIRQYRPKV